MGKRDIARRVAHLSRTDSGACQESHRDDWWSLEVPEAGLSRAEWVTYILPPFNHLVHSSSSYCRVHFGLVQVCFISRHFSLDTFHSSLVGVQFKMTIRTTVWCLLVAILLNIFTFSPAFVMPKSQNYGFEFEESEAEQCYFSIPGSGKNRLQNGQCMSMNGPDGCCLDGHYKPGLCSNLGHICCTKPDPDCSGMRNNKGKSIYFTFFSQKLISNYIFLQPSPSSLFNNRSVSF